MRSQIVVEIGLLGKKSDLCLHARIVQLHAEDFGAAASREDQPHQHLQGGGFAGAIRTKKPKDFALFHDEAQRMQGALRLLSPEANLILLLQPKNFDCRHGETISSETRSEAQ